MTHPSRKQRELALRQEIIFEAAEAVLAERGFHRASVDEVAKRAEVSVGTLYNLFGNKENLYTSLLVRGVEEVRETVRGRVAGATTGIDKLHAALDAIFAYFAEHQRAFRVYVTASHGLEWNVLPQFGDRVFQSMQAFLGDITGLCRLAVREGSLPRIDPALLAMAVMGTVNSYVTHWATHRRGQLSAYQAGAHAVLQALSRGRVRPVSRLHGRRT
jgi:TetR/AcrR family transcriptional regulator